MDQYTTNNNDRDNNNAYTWQNPNPYNNGYSGYTDVPKKEPVPKKVRKKASGTTVALISVSAVAAMLFIAVCVMYVIITSGGSKNKLYLQGSDTHKNENVNNGSAPEDKTDEQNSDVVLPDLETTKPTTGALSIPQIYAKLKDSVVGITVTVAGAPQISQGSGTGIVLSEDGYISTNAHVVNGATTIKVILANNQEYNAQIIGLDEKTDLAVIKIEATGLTPAEIGDSNTLLVGETVVAIGNPYGIELAGTVTSGIVSALNRQLEIEGTYMTLIQTDASINPGNSGGPLVNAYGQVIGITSSKIVTTGYEGIGFAIPITGATDIIEELIQYGYIKNRPFIGIQGSDLDATYASLYGIPNGVYVQYVDPESDAYSKGLKKGDIITAINGVEIASMAELDAEKNKNKPGDSITLTVYRNTKYLDITIMLSESSGE